MRKKNQRYEAGLCVTCQKLQGQERRHGGNAAGLTAQGRLSRLPSEGYHQIAGAIQKAAQPAGSSSWKTTDGFWLRYHGRDDREEATADAFAWWVMDQAGQPQPFFPGTPVTTDYADVAQSIEDALRTAAASARS